MNFLKHISLVAVGIFLMTTTAVFAESYYVTLSLATDDPRVAKVVVSNNADFSMSQTFPYQTAIPWDICGGQSCESGSKTVYVRYLDASDLLLGTASKVFQYTKPTPAPAPVPVAPAKPKPVPIVGCMDTSALNYDSKATEDGGNCSYPIPAPVPSPVFGCIDPLATNYSAVATQNDGSCVYPKQAPVITVEEATTAGAIAGGSIGLLGIILAGLTHGSIFSEIGFIPVRLAFWMFAFLGIRKKGKSWGVVYDSKTKQALDPVYVTLLNAGTDKEVMTALTDMEGRYGFLAPKGQYKITAGKTHYEFPSKDSGYKGEPFMIDETGVVAIDVPMDPASFDWNEYEKQRMGAVSWLVRYRGALGILSRIIFWIGFVVSIVSFVLSITLLSGIVLAVNSILAVIHIGIKKKQSYGVVYHAITRRPYSGIEMRFTMPEQPSIVIKKVVTDVRGRYYALLKAGTYSVSFIEKGSDGERVLGVEKVTLKEGMCDRDFVLTTGASVAHTVSSLQTA